MTSPDDWLGYASTSTSEAATALSGLQTMKDKLGRIQSIGGQAWLNSNMGRMKGKMYDHDAEGKERAQD